MNAEPLSSMHARTPKRSGDRLRLHGSCPQRLRLRRRRVRVLALITSAVILGACSGVLSTPSQEASSGQMMMDMVDALNQVRDQSAGMQDQLDSLREVVYQQDTVIRRLAAAAGVPVPPVR
ncbi:MAG: hypothetical protein ACO1Q7_01080 [Gemmatimonas sp.]